MHSHQDVSFKNRSTSSTCSIKLEVPTLPEEPLEGVDMVTDEGVDRLVDEELDRVAEDA